MNYDGVCYIIFDKFAGGSHNFKNALTLGIDIKSLFESDIEYYEGKNAVNKFNQMFSGNFVIPNDLELDIMNIYMFSFSSNDLVPSDDPNIKKIVKGNNNPKTDSISNVNIIITVVSIDTKKMTEYYKKNNSIPNKQFIINACVYHTNYERTHNNEINNDSIIDNIVKAAMIPNPDIMGQIIDHPNFIKDHNLYDYQRRSIRWMLDIERQEEKIYYGTNHKFEVSMGSLVFDPIGKTLIMRNEKDNLPFNGGALIDEVGLGKTIQMLTLCLLNPSKNIDYTISYKDVDNIDRKMLRSRATLILCPNQLCGQWSREITKMIDKKDLNVILLLTKNHFDKVTYQELLDADFVIVSYNFVGNECFATKYTSKISTSKSYCKSTLWNRSTVRKVLNEISSQIVNDPTSLFKTETLFPLIYWHRIIVDEFHEAFTVSKYKFVENIIPLLVGQYRWIVTGTPFDKGNDCFYHMLDYVTNYRNTLGKNIIGVNEVNKYMYSNFFRRNTKKSIEDEFKLPELKEKLIWLKFTHTERMMYNAYLTDQNVDKFSEIIRQICCHPKIADEIKGVLSTCKTLDDIQQTMVSHYESQYEQAEETVDKCKKSIAKTERRILIVEYKRQRKYLRISGYRVKIELPKFEYEDEKGMNLEDEDEEDEDLNDDDDDSDDDSKPLMIVSVETQKQVLSIVQKKLNQNPSITLNNMRETLKNQNDRLTEAVNIHKGKKASYDFFKNMLDTIKKATDKAKTRYELEMKKAQKKDEDEDEDEDDEDEDEDEEEENDEDMCGICMNEISGDDVGVTKCGHIYCYDCLKAMVNQNHRCPTCNNGLKITDISLISYEKPVFTAQNSEILRNKLELINKVGTKLTNLIYYLKSIDEHVIVFSQWDSLLRKVGDVLSDHGISNVFCRGNVWTRDKAIREFNSKDDIKVIMLSSESAASGTNLTKASKVILLDPVYGPYEYRRNMEWQAVGRAYRMGQKRSVEIVRFIIKDTVEEEIYKMNKEEDLKQKTQHNISESTDETITLSDDKLVAISESLKKSQEEKERKIAVRKSKRELKASAKKVVAKK